MPRLLLRARAASDQVASNSHCDLELDSESDIVCTVEANARCMDTVAEHDTVDRRVDTAHDLDRGRGQADLVSRTGSVSRRRLQDDELALHLVGAGHRVDAVFAANGSKRCLEACSRLSPSATED